MSDYSTYNNPCGGEEADRNDDIIVQRGFLVGIIPGVMRVIAVHGSTLDTDEKVDLIGQAFINGQWVTVWTGDTKYYPNASLSDMYIEYTKHLNSLTEDLLFYLSYLDIKPKEPNFFIISKSLIYDIIDEKLRQQGIDTVALKSDPCAIHSLVQPKKTQNYMLYRGASSGQTLCGFSFHDIVEWKEKHNDQRRVIRMRVRPGIFKCSSQH